MANQWQRRNRELLRHQRRVHLPYAARWPGQGNLRWPGDNQPDFQDLLALPSKSFNATFVLGTMLGYAMWQESNEPHFRSNFGYVTTNYMHLFYYFPFEHPRFHVSTLVRVFTTYLDALLRALAPTRRWPGPRYQLMLVRRQAGANYYDEQIVSGNHHVLYSTQAMRSHQLHRFANLPLENWRGRGRALAQELHLMAHSQPLDTYENILGGLGNENPDQLTYCLKILNPLGSFRWEQFRRQAFAEAQRHQNPGINGALHWIYEQYLEPFARDVWAEYERREPVPPDPGFARRHPGQRRRQRLPRPVLAPIPRRRPQRPVAQWPHAVLYDIMPAVHPAPPAPAPRRRDRRQPAGRRELAALLGPGAPPPPAARMTRAQARAAARQLRPRARAVEVQPIPRARPVAVQPIPRARPVAIQPIPRAHPVAIQPPPVPPRRQRRRNQELLALLAAGARPAPPGPIRTRARAQPREVRALLQQPVLPRRLRPRVGRGLPQVTFVDLGLM